MGLIGLIKLAVLCVDFLAWPVIALGYPLFASIKAVETGSKYHMRKLVVYWTIFALISLFEFAFVKIIEWIPFWSSVRLVAIIWLVMPQFDGACHAYDSLVRHVLLVYLQAVIDKLYRRNEEKLHKRATFLDVAEQYIKENGSEALEKLIASKAMQQECKDCNNFPGDIHVLELEEKITVQTLKLLKEPDAALHHHGTLKAPYSAATDAKWHEFKECDNSERDIQVVEPVLTNVVATSKQLKELDVSQNDSGMLEATKRSAASEVKRVQYAQPKPSAWVPKGTEAAAAKVKEAIPPAASVENRCPETPLKRVQLKEPVVAQHETLEATKKSAAIEAKWVQTAQHAQSKTTAWIPKGTEAGATKVKDTPSHEAIAENGLLETPPIKKVQQEKTFDSCKMKTTNENAHLQGSKHNFKCALKASKLDSERDIQAVLLEDKNAAATSKQVQNVQSKTTASAWVPKGSEAAAAKAKDAAPPEASAENKQIVWTCDLCRVTNTGEKTLNAHFQGSTHKSNCESLKASKLNAKDTGLSPKGTGKSNHTTLEEAGQTSSVKTQEENQFQTKPKQEGAANQIFKRRCVLCDVKLISDIDLAAHLRGKRHMSNIKAMPNPKAVFS